MKTNDKNSKKRAAPEKTVLRYAVLIVDDSHLGSCLSYRPDDALQLSGHLIGVG